MSFGSLNPFRNVGCRLTRRFDRDEETGNLMVEGGGSTFLRQKKKKKRCPRAFGAVVIRVLCTCVICCTRTCMYYILSIMYNVYILITIPK